MRIVVRPSVLGLRSLAFVIMLLASMPAASQTVSSFEDLPSLVNLNDIIQVHDASGGQARGRLTVLAPDRMALQTGATEKVFASHDVGTVSLRHYALRKSALLGAGIVAVLGGVAVCANTDRRACAVVGPLAAAPIGAGVGLTIGALVPRMKTVYRRPGNRDSAATPRVPDTEHQSLFEDLGLRVNLDDVLQITDSSGTKVVGRVTHFTADEIAIDTGADEQHFVRTRLSQVALRRHPLRAATLVGAGAGAVYGAVAACHGIDRSECPDGAIFGAAIGSGAGLIVGLFVNQTEIVYPTGGRRQAAAIRIVPSFARNRAAIVGSWSW